VSRLLLVRHGQASFLQADYDQLSPLGERQARLLGQYWAARRKLFHRAVTGPRRRQRKTAEIVARAYADAGLRFPEITVAPEFDEYRAEEVVKACLAPLVAADPAVAELHRAFLAAASPAERHATFQKVIEVLIERWASGILPAPGVEPWPEFSTRVNRGISQFLAARSAGETSVIFSSGGPIAIASQRALNLALQDVIRLSWMSRNGSYTEFLVTSGRFTLSSFNAFPHLDSEELLTYR